MPIKTKSFRLERSHGFYFSETDILSIACNIDEFADGKVSINGHISSANNERIASLCVAQKEIDIYVVACDPIKNVRFEMKFYGVIFTTDTGDFMVRAIKNWTGIPQSSAPYIMRIKEGVIDNTSMYHKNPISYIKDSDHCDPESGYTTEGWYFFEETWAHVDGPYKTADMAKNALKNYIDTFLKGRTNGSQGS
jgi:hypothetical protein